jgi:hypothetical protein
MSKINIEFDTQTKELRVFKDGQTMGEISYISIQRYAEEESGIVIEQISHDDNERVTVSQTTYAGLAKALKAQK